MSSQKGVLSAGRPSVKTGDNRKSVTLASLSDEQPVKRVNFNLPADQHTKLKVYAARQGKTVRELLTEYVCSLDEE